MVPRKLAQALRSKQSAAAAVTDIIDAEVVLLEEAEIPAEQRYSADK